MMQTNANRMKEPRCCGCYRLTNGAVAIIMVHFMFWIFGILGIFQIPFVFCIWIMPIVDILFVFCGIIALCTKSKCLAVISSVLLFTGAFGFCILAILSTSRPKCTIGCIFWAILKMYWGNVWIRIADYFQEVTQVELVIRSQNPNHAAMHQGCAKYNQQFPRYGNAPLADTVVSV